MASINLNTDGSGVTRDFLPLVRTMLGYPPSDSTRDLILAQLTEIAMQKYSEIAPRIARRTITTVAQQLAYPLPDDCRTVYEVYLPSQTGFYNDSLFLPMLDTPSSSLFGYSDYAYRSPSERIIRAGIFGELDHYGNGFTGYQVELGVPSQISVYPLPTASGLTVLVRYGAEHPNSSSDPLTPTYITLPPGHYKYVLTLIKWAVAAQRADMLTTTMQMSGEAGGSKQLTESWQLSNRAERILQEVRMAVGADATIALRS